MHTEMHSHVTTEEAYAEDCNERSDYAAKSGMWLHVLNFSNI